MDDGSGTFALPLRIIVIGLGEGGCSDDIMHMRRHATGVHDGVHTGTEKGLVSEDEECLGGWEERKQEQDGLHGWRGRCRAHLSYWLSVGGLRECGCVWVGWSEERRSGCEGGERVK